LKKLVFGAIILLLTLVACGGSRRTSTGEVLFRDEFNAELAEGWQWGNEDPSRWKITDDGWLAITADNPTLKVPSEIIGQVNVLLREAPTGDIVYTTHIQANPSEEFQQAAIYLIKDGDNYVAINTEFCPGCNPQTGGYSINMEAVKENLPLLEQPFIARDPQLTDLYLRLVYSSTENTITGFYATSPGEYQQAFVVENPAEFNLIALGATNAPGPLGIQQDVVAMFDWVEISRP